MFIGFCLSAAVIKSTGDTPHTLDRLCAISYIVVTFHHMGICYNYKQNKQDHIHSINELLHIVHTSVDYCIDISIIVILFLGYALLISAPAEFS